MRRDDELSLLHRIASRDRGAFEAFYSLYYRRLFSYLFKITRRAEMVEEVVNDVMLVVWTKAHTFDGRSRPSTWVFGIAYHKAMKALAQRRPAEQQAGDADNDMPEMVDADEPESLLARRQLATTLGRALLELSAEQRSVVELTYFVGLSYLEISQVMACPVNTVKTRMFHARRRLRELLPDMGVSSHAG
jgi:RNA polymerase sigma factor (sigma-70 family)